MPTKETGHGANLVGVPAMSLSTAAFNATPVPLRIAGVHDAHSALFDALEHCTHAASAADAFERHMNATFRLEMSTSREQPGVTCHPREGGDPDHTANPLDPRLRGDDGMDTTTLRRRFRTSYLRLLRGWGFDANSREGAVLKSWVESRFGIYPTFHKMPLTSFASEAWSNYVVEKMSSRFHNNAIFMQLDLLYEFCQWSFARWHGQGRHLTLYRGVNDFDEHRLIDERADGESVLRLNNLVSFSANRAVAGEFGDCLLEVQVPTVKVLFHSDLLPRHPLKGEQEYLVIGGDYRVKTSYL